MLNAHSILMYNSLIGEYNAFNQTNNNNNHDTIREKKCPIG